MIAKLWNLLTGWLLKKSTENSQVFVEDAEIILNVSNGAKMEPWKTAIDFVLAYEGGYVNDPQDPGGETNRGISKRSYPKEDIKGMTRERAEEIYRSDYWNPCHCDELPSELAICVFDCAVNQGARKARRLLQLSLNMDVTGSIKPENIGAAHKDCEGAVRKFLAHRLADYMQIILKNPKLEIYRFNWSYRVIKLAALVFEMA